MRPQPAPGWCGIFTVQHSHQRVKFSAMIHVNTVRDLVRDSRPPHMLGRQNESPAIAKITRGRTAAPTRHWISNGYTAKRDTNLCCTGATFFLKQNTGLGLDPSKQTKLERSVRPADTKAGPDATGFARIALVPFKRQHPAGKSYAHAGLNWLRRRKCSQLRFNPASLGFSPAVSLHKPRVPWNCEANACVARTDDKSHLSRAR